MKSYGTYMKEAMSYTDDNAKFTDAGYSISCTDTKVTITKQGSNKTLVLWENNPVTLQRLDEYFKEA